MEKLLAITESKLLESHWFRTKPQMQRLLSYLIKHSYENNTAALQQKEIAVECLGRGDDFIPSRDPVVRIEAARLRKLLDSFYDEAPQTTPYRVSLPKGSYQVRFSQNEDRSISTGLALLVICQISDHASTPALALMLRVRRELVERFAKFNHVELMVEYLPKHQVAQKGMVHFLAEKQHDYVLRVEVLDDGKGSGVVSSVAIHRLSQEILWSHSALVAFEAPHESLAIYYKHVVGSLVADSFGLLGQHWVKYVAEEGVGSLPTHKQSWAYLIDLINKPTISIAADYLAFLRLRLEKHPFDHVAYSGYLYLGLYDLMLNFQLFTGGLEERCAQANRAVNDYPAYDAFSVLLGIYCFALGEFSKAKVYLGAARQLNPFNTCWEFIFGGVLFFMGEKEKGIELIERIYQNSTETHTLPGYYRLPEFLYHFEKKDRLKVFRLGLKIGFSTKELEEIGALKSNPELIQYCRTIFNRRV